MLQELWLKLHLVSKNSSAQVKTYTLKKTCISYAGFFMSVTIDIVPLNS